MEEAEKLLKTMHSLIQQAGALSGELVSFIRAESLPLGEVMGDWMEAASYREERIAGGGCGGGGSCSSGQIFISEPQAERLVESRRAATWVEAKRKFASRELELLKHWQKLEVRALALSINMILGKHLVDQNGG